MTAETGHQHESLEPGDLDVTQDTFTRRQVMSGIGAGLLTVGCGSLMGRRRGSDQFTAGEDWPGGTYHSDITFTRRTTIDAGNTVTLDPDRDIVVTFAMTNASGGQGTTGLIVYGSLVSRPNPGHAHQFKFNGSFSETHFTGATSADNGDAIVDSDIGIWIRDGGRLDLHGTPRTRLARLNAAGNPGDSSVAMNVPKDWETGDVLVIAGTAPTTTSGFFDTSEMFTVGMGTTPTRLCLASYKDGPNSLQVAHRPVSVAGHVYYPEILNLSSNLAVHGAPTRRIHIHICQPNHGARHIIDNVEISNMGPRDVSGNGFRGRYPLHFHDCGGNTSGLVVESCVIHSCGSHAFVPHMSKGITLSNCVTHNTQDIAYWWDDGDQTDSCTWTNCVASNCYATAASFQLGITNHSTISDCISICQQGEATSSGYLWPKTSNRTGGFWTMTDCIAHNSRDLGMYPYLNNFVSDSPVHSGFVAYNCGGAGSEHGAYGNYIRFRKMRIAHCGGAPLDPPVDGSLVLEMASPSPTNLVYYDDCSFDASCLSYSALVIKWTAGKTATPAQFLNCRFDNALGRAVSCINAGDSATQLTRTDFIGCTVDGASLRPSDIELAGVLPGTTFRIQDQSDSISATKLSSDGSVTKISAFYPSRAELNPEPTIT
jgi:hypothetical protein